MHRLAVSRVADGAFSPHLPRTRFASIEKPLPIPSRCTAERIENAFEGAKRRRWPLSTIAAAASTSSPPTEGENSLLVKVCGVTHPDDAALAAAAGADLVGVIMWPKAKRAVSAGQARAIGEAARKAAASAKSRRRTRRRRSPALVGVFVDENAEEIARAAEEADLDYVQLHGDGARGALPELLELRARRERDGEKGSKGQSFGVVFVLTVGSDGVPTSATPDQILSGDAVRRSMEIDPMPDLILVDGPAPGSGEAWDWGGLVERRTDGASPPPLSRTREGAWLLAGGLCPENVGGAVSALGPGGVDVSSGVCGPDGLRKDERRIASFVEAARGATTE